MNATTHHHSPAQAAAILAAGGDPGIYVTPPQTGTEARAHLLTWHGTPSLLYAALDPFVVHDHKHNPVPDPVHHGDIFSRIEAAQAAEGIPAWTDPAAEGTE